MFQIKKGGVSTKKIDKAHDVVFWICFWTSIVLCLAAWVNLYLDPVIHWLGMSDNYLIFTVTVTTFMAAVFVYLYYLRKKQHSRNS